MKMLGTTQLELYAEEIVEAQLDAVRAGERERCRRIVVGAPANVRAIAVNIATASGIEPADAIAALKRLN